MLTSTLIILPNSSIRYLYQKAMAARSALFIPGNQRRVLADGIINFTRKKMFRHHEAAICTLKCNFLQRFALLRPGSWLSLLIGHDAWPARLWTKESESLAKGIIECTDSSLARSKHFFSREVYDTVGENAPLIVWNEKRRPGSHRALSFFFNSFFFHIQFYSLLE